MKFKFFLILFLVLLFQVSAAPVFAASDPRLRPNNIVGINSLSPESEISDTASLVNMGGNWGYMVLVIKKDERDIKRWQDFLDRARQENIIPIIRLATVFDKNGYWQRPDENDSQDWANFLSKLYFPTKNRYVQIYNEVNAAGEWGGKVDPAGYARELIKTIDALKLKSSDFFVLNAPLDLSAPTSEDYLDASVFFQEMEEAVPGIFAKLDGWASHSYPNPAFSSPPSQSGRTSINGFVWELDQIGRYTENKDLPVFITETGWKRSMQLTEDKIANYYRQAFEYVWNDKRIAAVAPFVLSYPEPLFNQFSFVNFKDSDKAYHSYFSEIVYLPKVKGEPERKNLIAEVKIDKPEVILKDVGYKINFKFKNVGNFVWNSKKDLKLKVISDNIAAEHTVWNREEISPGEEVQASLSIKGKFARTVPLKLEIIHGDQVLAKSESFITVETRLSLFVKKLKSFLPNG